MKHLSALLITYGYCLVHILLYIHLIFMAMYKNIVRKIFAFFYTFQSYTVHYGLLLIIIIIIDTILPYLKFDGILS